MPDAATVLTGIAVAAAVAGAVISVVKDKRNGRCTGGCGSCPHAGACKKKSESQSDNTTV